MTLGLLHRAVFTLFLTLLGTSFFAQAANIEYVYDDLGRLVEAVDTTANKATYVYDADGNLVSVTQAAATQVVILNFSPKQGAAGTPVVISGSGFSTTLASNTVKFNGVVATVTAATSTTLTVVVPTGATTGLINVTSPTGTATSTTNFVIGNFLPVISGFTPTIGSVDTPVTISGSNFDAVPKANRVEFNGMIASVATGTTASIATTVPRNTGSGPIRVTTPNGSALSSTDFFVVPNPDSSANVATAARVNVGDTATASLAAGKGALYVFNGIAQQLLTVGVSGVTSTNLSVSVYLPDGSVLASAAFGTAGGGLQLPALPKSGVYTVYVKAAIAGNATITIAPPMTGTLMVGGAPLSLNITPPGRRALISFAGTVGQAVELSMTGVTLSASKISVLKPDGSELLLASVGTTGGKLRPVLSVAGTYAVLVDPSGSISGNMTIALTNIVSQLVVNGPTYSGNISVTGQSTQVCFSGTARQYLNLEVREPINVATNLIGAVTITVLKPDGTLLGAATTVTALSSGGSAYFFSHQNLPVLPISGVYCVVVQPTSGTTGAITFELTGVATGVITPNGADTAVSVSRTGQGIQATFNGAAGQYLNLEVREPINVATNLIGAVTITVLKPDGTLLGAATTVPALSSGGSAYFFSHQNLPVLPLSGTYTVLVQQNGASISTTGTGALVFAVTSPVTGTLTIGGGAVALSITRIGQGAQLTFTGTAAQNLALTMSTVCNSITGGSITVLKPDNTTLSSANLAMATCTGGVVGNLTLNIPTLPVTGTYTVLFQQTSSGIGTLTSTLNTR